MYIFSMDNPFFQFIGKLVDLVWLNILTLVCCLPVFTAGAALSAMYSVLIKMALKEDGVITKPFFRAFKENLKKSTTVWIPSLLILVVMAMNIYLMYKGVFNEYPSLFIPVGLSIGIISIAVIIILHYALALISRYDSDVKQTVKNAILLSLAYFPRSLCIFIIWLSPLALMRISFNFLFFWFLYGFSFPGYFASMIFGNLFLKTEDITENESKNI